MNTIRYMFYAQRDFLLSSDLISLLVAERQIKREKHVQADM